VTTLESLGCRVVRVDLDGADEAQRHMFNILYPDAAAFHAERAASRPELFGPEALDRLGGGRRRPDDVASLTWRRAWQRKVERVFPDVDVVVTLTLPGHVKPVERGGMIATPHPIIRFTYPWATFTGPSLSVPCGFHGESGRPIGADLTAAPLARRHPRQDRSCLSAGLLPSIEPSRGRYMGTNFLPAGEKGATPLLNI